MADVEQTAEQQLLGVLHVGVIIGARLHTPDDRRSYYYSDVFVCFSFVISVIFPCLK